VALDRKSNSLTSKDVDSIDDFDSPPRLSRRGGYETGSSLFILKGGTKDDEAACDAHWMDRGDAEVIPVNPTAPLLPVCP
jgi:hypothetical protein